MLATGPYRELVVVFWRLPGRLMWESTHDRRARHYLYVRCTGLYRRAEHMAAPLV
jgi:hypothetical protein